MLHYLYEYALKKILLVIPIYIFIIVYKIIHFNSEKKSKHISLTREIFVTLFLLYLTTLFAVTVINFNFVHGNGVFGFYNFVNVIPITHIIENFININNLSNGDKLSFLMNVFINLIMFIPFGFFLPALWDIKAYKVMLFGALISLLIEILQLPFLRGSDIDDIILNTTSVIIGYAIYSLLRKKSSVLSYGLKKIEAQ